MRNKRVIKYGPTDDEFIVVESLMDEIRLAQCMKIYKIFDTIKKLEKGLKKKTLTEINKIH